MKKKILIVDDHPILCFGLTELIKLEKDLVVCGTAGASGEALTVMRESLPDMVILDITLPGVNGIELLKLMKAEQPHLLFLMFSKHDESLYALRALKAGALGYIMKTEPVSEILKGLRKVLNQELYISQKLSEHLIFQAIQGLEGMGSPADKLSDRELEILELLGRGFGTKKVALELHLSAKTIETHRAHIKEKLHLKDASELIQFAIDWVAQENEA